MDHIFDARCNCLMSTDNVSTEFIADLTGRLKGFGLTSDLVMTNVKRMGNWVGGHVYVSQDTVTFSTNALNKAFQRDSSDLVVPTAMILGVEMGKMMKIAKTVDCDVAGNLLRFRCFGSTNDKLLAAIRSVSNTGLETGG